MYQAQLESERFILRPFRHTDEEGLFALDSDPEVMKYLGGVQVQHREDIRNQIQHVHNQYAEYGIGRLVITDKKTGDFIGWAGLRYERDIRPDQPYYDVGYRILRKYWGQGIATETARESIRHGLEDLGLSALHACADVNHVVSNHVLQKVGMQWVEQFVYDEIQHNWYVISNAV